MELVGSLIPRTIAEGVLCLLNSSLYEVRTYLIRATVARFPYLAEGRNSDLDVAVLPAL